MERWIGICDLIRMLEAICAERFAGGSAILGQAGCVFAWRSRRTHSEAQPLHYAQQFLQESSHNCRRRPSRGRCDVLEILQRGLVERSADPLVRRRLLRNEASCVDNMYSAAVGLDALRSVRGAKALVVHQTTRETHP